MLGVRSTGSARTRIWAARSRPFSQRAKAGHERFLLGRGAQAEGDRAGPADDGEPVGTEIDDPFGADPSERQAQRVGHRTGARGRGTPGRRARRRRRAPGGGGCDGAATPRSPTGRRRRLRTGRGPAWRRPPRPGGRPRRTRRRARRGGWRRSRPTGRRRQQPRMASWRAVRPASSLSGRSTSAGIRTRPRSPCPLGAVTVPTPAARALTPL